MEIQDHFGEFLWSKTKRATTNTWIVSHSWGKAREETDSVRLPLKTSFLKKIGKFVYGLILWCWFAFMIPN